MTEVLVPEFIIGIFEKEFNTLFSNKLQQISIDYNISFEELKEKYIIDYKYIDKKTKNIVIKEKRIYNPNISQNDRCLARTWNEGRGGQCKRKKSFDNNLFKNHLKILNDKGKLKHGLITDEKSFQIFSNKLKEKLY